MPEQKEYTIGSMETKKQEQSPLGGGPGRMQGTGEKAQNFSAAMKSLLKYCKKYLPAILFAVMLAVAGAVLNIIGPDKLSEMTDLISMGLGGSIALSAIAEIGLVLVILYGLGFVFNLIQGVLMANITQKISFQLRGDISEKINRLPLAYFDTTSYGDILSRVTNDVDTIGQSLTQSLSSLVTSVATLAGGLVMMFATNWLMAISGVLATLVGFVLMIVIIGRSQKYFVRQQTELGLVNGHVEETYAGHAVVKVYNGEAAARREFAKMNEALYDSAWRSQFLSGQMMPVMTFIGNFGYVVVCVVGAILALNGAITFGVIVAFMMYIRMFTQPLSQLAQVATSMQSAAAASERVFAFLSQQEIKNESDKKERLDTTTGTISFSHVRFGYSPQKTIIHDFSAEVKSAQKIAIVGPTGAGKTTLVNLLMRFYELDAGQIKIDGISSASLTRENIHKLFGMVLQDTWLFEGTLRENIVYNTPNVTEEQVVSACKAVGLHHFISTLPQGYDTILDDNSSLSAGQRQLVTIARAMVENAPMMILDEATSSVDTRTEAMIQRAMDRLMQGRTSFVIAHRLSTIRNADMILVMKDGDIIENGTHDELIARNGFYAELYNSQFTLAS